MFNNVIVLIYQNLICPKIGQLLWNRKVSCNGFYAFGNTIKFNAVLRITSFAIDSCYISEARK